MNKHSEGPSAPLLRRTQRGAMLYDASRAGNASVDWFAADFWLKRGGAVPPPAGRGDALFIRHEGKEWILRHYRRGGLAARVSRDLYLWTGGDSSRPFAEWRLLLELHRKGLPVPPPVAAQYERIGPLGLFYRADLITERIAGGQPLSSRLAVAPLLPFVWEKIGRCIRQFHDAGVCHADLNAHNILIVEPLALFLIDFDRSDIREPGDWQAANVSRFHRSLRKIARSLPPGRFSEADWQAVLRGYG